MRNPSSRNMRPAIVRLQALERDHAATTPYGGAPEHAVAAIRLAANLLTRQAEVFGATGPADLARYARTVAEFDALRSTLADLQKMADAYHPATPEARSLNHAAMALRMAADVLTGRRLLPRSVERRKLVADAVNRR